MPKTSKVYIMASYLGMISVYTLNRRAYEPARLINYGFFDDVSHSGWIARFGHCHFTIKNCAQLDLFGLDCFFTGGRKILSPTKVLR